MTEFEEMQLKTLKHYLRLSMERDLYTFPEAAFRFNCSENKIEDEFIVPYRIKIFIRNGRKFIPKTEVERVMNELPLKLHKNAL